MAIIGTIMIEYILEYLSPLGVADESYCSDKMMKIGAIFALVLMVSIIGFLIYCFIVSPFVLNTGSCSKG